MTLHETCELFGLYSQTWIDLLKLIDFNEDFLKENAKRIKWYNIVRYQKLSEELLTELIENRLVSCYLICRNQKLSESFIEKYAVYFGWREICFSQHLSEAFIEKHQYEVSWDVVSSNMTPFSEEFIWKFRDRIDWCHLSWHQELSEAFLLKCRSYLENHAYFIHNKTALKNTYINFLKKPSISENFLINNCEIFPLELYVVQRQLSETFFRQYFAKNNQKLYSPQLLHDISLFQDLTEEFINDFSEFLNWDYICQKQILSEEFINNHLSKVNFYALIVNQNLSKRFILKVIPQEYHKMIFNNLKNLTLDKLTTFKKYLQGNSSKKKNKNRLYRLTDIDRICSYWNCHYKSINTQLLKLVIQDIKINKH